MTDRTRPECIHGVSMKKPCARCQADLLPIGPAEVVDLHTRRCGCIYHPSKGNR